eukprot:351599-Chlamydomonas_euryale.AAC.12
MQQRCGLERPTHTWPGTGKDLVARLGADEAARMKSVLQAACAAAAIRHERVHEACHQSVVRLASQPVGGTVSQSVVRLASRWRG